MHRVSAAALPPPFATPSAGNGPSASSRPSGAELALPPRFHAEVYTNKLSHPRKLLVAPNGDVFRQRDRGGTRFRAASQCRRQRRGARRPLSRGSETAFRPRVLSLGAKPAVALCRGNDAGHASGGIRSATAGARGAGEVVAPDLPQGGGHFTATLHFPRMDRRCTCSVGSATNIGDDMPRKSAQEIQVWRRTQAPGAPGGRERRPRRGAGV